MAPKPGVIPLRPLDVGEILNGVFATIRYNFLAVYGMPVVAGVGGLLLLLAFGVVEWSPLHAFYVDLQNNAGNPGWSPSSSEKTNAIIALVGLLLLLFVSYEATLIGATLGSVATLRHAVVGRRVGFRQIASEAAPSLLRLTGAMLLVQLLSGGPFILVIGLMILLAAFTSGSAVGAIMLFGFLLAMAAAVWSLVAYIRLVPVCATVVLEGKGPVEGIKRAWRLNEGAWWRSFGVTLLATVAGAAAQYAFNQILSIFYLGVTGLSGISAPVNTTDPAVAQHLLASEFLFLAMLMPLGLLSGLLIMPVMPLTQGLLYIDRRIRRESLDIHLAEEAGVPFAGHVPQPPRDTPPPTPAG